MKALAGGFFISVACLAPLFAQERDGSLERIRLGLQQPPTVTRGVDAVESAAPKALGIFTLVPPTHQGEIVRISVPIGELVARPFKSAAAANRRRQEVAARRRVEAALERFKEQVARTQSPQR